MCSQERRAKNGTSARQTTRVFSEDEYRTMIVSERKDTWCQTPPHTHRKWGNCRSVYLDWLEDGGTQATRASGFGGLPAFAEWTLPRMARS